MIILIVAAIVAYGFKRKDIAKWILIAYGVYIAMFLVVALIASLLA